MQASAHPDPPDDVPLDAGIDLAAALRRLGGDVELLRELAAIYVQDAPELVLQATSALAQRDLQQAAHAAHSLKGLSSNFSAAAAAAAQAAEDALRDSDVAGAHRTMTALRTYIERLISELERTVLQ
jgi:HPt (histidine-containing phosphotransfer) domain-containing protein